MALVVTTCRTPVSVLVAVTVAFAITAPVASSTVPEMLPPAAAAQVNTGNPSRRVKTRSGKADGAVSVRNDSLTWRYANYHTTLAQAKSDVTML